MFLKLSRFVVGLGVFLLWIASVQVVGALRLIDEEKGVEAAKLTVTDRSN